MDGLWWIHQNVAVLIEPQHRGRWMEKERRPVQVDADMWMGKEECKKNWAVKRNNINKFKKQN